MCWKSGRLLLLSADRWSEALIGCLADFWLPFLARDFQLQSPMENPPSRQWFGTGFVNIFQFFRPLVGSFVPSGNQSWLKINPAFRSMSFLIKGPVVGDPPLPRSAGGFLPLGKRT